MSPSIRYLLVPPPYRKHHNHSTVQHSAVNPRDKQQKPSTRRSERDNAGKQTELARASTLSSSIQLAVCDHKNEPKKSKCLLPSTKILLCGVMREGFACQVHCSKTSSPSVLFRPNMRRPGCFGGPWSSWPLEAASLHRTPWTSLCDSVIRILFNYFFMSERSGRRKPSAERSALYYVLRAVPNEEKKT